LCINKRLVGGGHFADGDAQTRVFIQCAGPCTGLFMQCCMRLSRDSSGETLAYGETIVVLLFLGRADSTRSVSGRLSVSVRLGHVGIEPQPQALMVATPGALSESSRLSYGPSGFRLIRSIAVSVRSFRAQVSPMVRRTLPPRARPAAMVARGSTCAYGGDVCG